jgi:hypothetical protein
MEGELFEGSHSKESKIDRTHSYVNLKYYPITVNFLRNTLYNGVSY